MNLVEQGKMDRVLSRTTVTAALLADIRKRIIADEFREGEPLRQDWLARQYNVSRIPVREALYQLAAEGLVDFSAHRGAVVSKLSIAEIQEYFDLRELIEVDLVKRAIPYQTPADIEVAANFAEKFDRLLRTKDEGFDKIGEANWEFHASLYKPAGRERSMGILKSLHNQAERYTRIQLVFAEGETRASDEHRELLEMCRSRKVSGAARVLREQIRNAGRSVTKYLVESREMVDQENTKGA